MTDSIDRVFVHALSTVKRIPKTGAMRPPPSERLRLYGLYKQAMEGDVDGVMERPTSALPGLRPEDVQREMDKWDAWNSQKGLTRTEAKRRYIETLIETMHRYATTGDGRELVSELEFVWDQVKSNNPSISDTPSSKTSRRKSAPPTTEGPMRILSPMSEQDEAERESQRRLGAMDDDEEDDAGAGAGAARRGGRWSRKIEGALVKLSTEVAALREHIATGREWRFKKEMSWRAWFVWLFWEAVRHLIIDLVVLSVVLIWMRKRKDRRLEDLVRAAFRLVREYVRNIVPSR